MQACNLLDGPINTGDPDTAAAIKWHDSWQDANASKIILENRMKSAQQRTQDDLSKVLPPGVRPCRNDQEREEYATKHAQPVIENHEKMKAGLMAKMREPGWQAK